jgi:hypothetical protein
MNMKCTKCDRSLPSLLHHVFNSDSRKVAFGWWLFISSTWLRNSDKIDVKAWLICVFLAVILIGGGTVVDEIIKMGKAFLEARFGGGKAAAPASSAPAAPPAAAAAAGAPQ